MPPTYAAGPPVSGAPEQLDPRGLAGILVAVALLALAIRPRRRAHGR
jgi:hypothetical protein